MTARRHAALAALLAATLAAEGCTGAEAPAAPGASGCDTARLALCSDRADAAELLAAVADAADRLAPALQNPHARTALAERMAILSVELDVGDVARARHSVDLLQATLAAARSDGSSYADDAADLDAIAITIQEAAGALRAP